MAETEIKQEVEQEVRAEELDTKGGVMLQKLNSLTNENDKNKIEIEKLN